MTDRLNAEERANIAARADAAAALFTQILVAAATSTAKKATVNLQQLYEDPSFPGAIIQVDVAISSYPKNLRQVGGPPLVKLMTEPEA